MTNKLKVWDQHSTWEGAEKAWTERAHQAAKQHPVKTLLHLPKMPGVTLATARFLRMKALYYLVKHDKNRVIPRYLLRLKFVYRLLKSYLQPSSFRQEGDFFLYGLKSHAEFETKIKNPKALIVIGFSYCHKPFECPSLRFSKDCIHDPDHPVCQQCFIGQMRHAMPESPRIIPLTITTIHHIGEEMCKIRAANPNKEILFLITACELTLKMFADFGNMIDLKGIGIRLDGRICNTMEAFHLSEQGVKPGLTVVLPPAAEQMLRWIRLIRTG
jgi:hypothetical protein